MTLEFIIGAGSYDPTNRLVRQAADWLQQDSKNQVFYLVPDHIKFETEIMVLQKLREEMAQQTNDMATMQVQVFSFSRLAWYYLQNTPFYPQVVLTDAGNGMLLRKVLLELEEQLTVFRGEINKPGFVEQVVSLINELQQGNISPDTLEEMLNNLGTTSRERDSRLKLQDIQLIYQSFQDRLLAENIPVNNAVQNLGVYLVGQNLSHITFILYGFNHLRAEELELLRVLAQGSASLKVALILDRPYVDKEPEKFNLFYETGRLYYQIYQMARSLHVPVLPDHYLKQNEMAIAADLQQLDQVWQQTFQFTNQAKSALKVELTGDQIQLWAGETPYAELQHTAREIRRLVAEGQCRYQDIVIVSRAPEYYGRMLEPVLITHNIPYYQDQESAMKHHPLLEFLRALFDIDRRGYRNSDILRFLRTELFFPEISHTWTMAEWIQKQHQFREKIDITENVVLAYGYEGRHWTQKKDWSYIRYNFDDVTVEEEEDQRYQRISNEIRQNLQQTLPAFFKKMKKAVTGREAAEHFYRFLLQVGVERQLLYWRDQEIERGRLENARIHEQTWQALIGLLDEYVLVLGDTPFLLEDFRQIFSAGLENATYNQVPATLDQVTITTLDHLRGGRKKVIFLLGATDQVLPLRAENKTLLSDEEREQLSENLSSMQFLQESAGGQLAREPLLAYRVFTAATQRLYLSYPLFNDSQKACRISPYLTILEQKLRLEPKFKSLHFRETDKPEPFIGTYRSLLSELIQVKRTVQDVKKPLNQLWQQLEKRLLSHTQYAPLATKILQSLSAVNLPEKLQPQLVEQLYGSTLYASVSRIESFYACSYKYLLQYGLGLRERDLFGLSPAAAGDFYHEALDQLFKTVISESLSLSRLTEDDVQLVVDQVLTKLFSLDQFAMLQSSERMGYIRHQLAATVRKVSWALHKQSEQTGFTPQQTEVLFGQMTQKQGLQSMDFNLSNNHQLKVRGKIDRIDVLETPESAFLSVIDYKSSFRQFDFRDAYYGLALQMITYLDIALNNAVKLIGKPARPAGGFYLHIQNPVLKGLDRTEDRERQLLDKFHYNGFLLEDKELLQNIEPKLAEKEKSFVYPLKRTAKGDWRSTQFINHEELQGLIRHNRRKFQEAGERIYQGETLLNPAYRDKQRIACTYCSFRSICQFDVLLPENNYHRLDQIKKDAALARILTEEQEGQADEPNSTETSE